MQGNIQALNAQRLRELANTPGVTVMDLQHDVHFEPWPVARVRAVVDELTALTREHGQEARERALAREHLATFASLYKVMFAKLTEPDFVGDESNMERLRKMLVDREKME